MLRFAIGRSRVHDKFELRHLLYGKATRRGPSEIPVHICRTTTRLLSQISAPLERRQPHYAPSLNRSSSGGEQDFDSASIGCD